MGLFELVNDAWLIEPTMLSTIQDIVVQHKLGPKKTKEEIAEIAAALGRPDLKNEPKGYDIVGKTAVLSVEGVLAKRMDMMTQVSGGDSYYRVSSELNAALADKKVESIILNIDSPGGTVDGAAELAALVKGARGQKPIVAFTDGMMASAAYWFGASADKVFISGDTTKVGSIAAIMKHVDISGAEKMKGVKTTEISGGKYKNIASEHGPLTEAGRKHLQERIDYLSTTFASDVADSRGLSMEDRADWADGRLFTGKQAIEAGLADGIATMDQLVGALSGRASDKGIMALISASGGRALAGTLDMEEDMKTVEELKGKHPELYAAVLAEGVASVDIAAGIAAMKLEDLAALDSVKGIVATAEAAAKEGLMTKEAALASATVEDLKDHAVVKGLLAAQEAEIQVGAAAGEKFVREALGPLLAGGGTGFVAGGAPAAAKSINQRLLENSL